MFFKQEEGCEQCEDKAHNNESLNRYTKTKLLENLWFKLPHQGKYCERHGRPEK